MPGDQSLVRVIHVQLRRAEQHIVVAGQIPAAAEQRIRLAQGRRQPEPQLLLGRGQISVRPAVAARQAAAPMGGETLDEPPCAVAPFDGGGEGRGEIELLWSAETISIPRTPHDLGETHDGTHGETSEGAHDGTHEGIDRRFRTGG
ncbi:hypothetical protein ABT147_30520 [Streptomyces sp. NPDC001868]|uniref:hypothetical protein n=1 Tax=Streptomyces sp. NPDC001868 TaxID=3154401 RepID=UPI00332CB666